jgi:hypothetical protein
MIVYPHERLYQEMAYIAFHLHWSYDEILQLEHHERRRWVDEIGAINTQLNAVTEGERAFERT